MCFYRTQLHLSKSSDLQYDIICHRGLLQNNRHCHYNKVALITIVLLPIAGDQVMEVNGQNFEKLSFEQAQAILKKNTDLSLTLKTNLFGKEFFLLIKTSSVKFVETVDHMHLLRL